MNKSIIFSDGCKGGVGKSMTTTCIADYLVTRNKRILLVDVDVKNPEVARLFEGVKNVATLIYDLREEAEWMGFGNSVEEHSEDIDHVVVNLPGSIDIGEKLNMYGEIFKLLKFDLSVFFTINRQPDSINLLGESLHYGAMKNADNKVVVKNGLFGLEEDFHRYYESEARNTLFSQGGKEVYIRELFHQSLDLCLLEHKKTFSLAVKDTMKLFTRYQIQKWVDDVHSALDAVFQKPASPVKNNQVAAECADIS